MTDPEAESHEVYLSPATLAFVDAWRAAAIAATLRRAALKTGMGREALQITGHSARLGAIQDMASAGVDTLAIMQAGRWKDSRMPARYSARLNARRGAMAKLAARQGRDIASPTE